ncbi:proto-oncogene serine/threonine-protein kinase mos [Discoglossus pictus]
MPSPIPVTRFLPRDLSPSIDLRPCSSPLELSHLKRSCSTRSAGPRLPPRLAWCSIDWDQVRLLEPVGSGGFGSVYRATYRGQTVAVKKVKRCSKNRLASRQSFWAEMNAARLRHPHLVQVLAASASCPGDPGSPGTIIMEYAGTTTLHSRLYSRGLPLGRDSCVRYAQHVASGLSFLHRGGVVHLDLKPANVLLAPGDMCKIGDFGCSHRLTDGEGGGDCIRHLGGTYTHRAPELLRGEPVTIKADIFSFGITLWQMVTREMPYTGDRHSVLYAVVAYDLRPSMGQVFMCTEEGQAVKDVVSNCWAARPGDRPSAEEILARLEVMQGGRSEQGLGPGDGSTVNSVQGLDTRDPMEGCALSLLQGLDHNDHGNGSATNSLHGDTLEGCALDHRDHVRLAKMSVQGLDHRDQGPAKMSVQGLDHRDQGPAQMSVQGLDHRDQGPAQMSVQGLDHRDQGPAQMSVQGLDHRDQGPAQMSVQGLDHMDQGPAQMSVQGLDHRDQGPAKMSVQGLDHRDQGPAQMSVQGLDHRDQGPAQMSVQGLDHRDQGPAQMSVQGLDHRDQGPAQMSVQGLDHRDQGPASNSMLGLDHSDDMEGSSVYNSYSVQALDHRHKEHDVDYEDSASDSLDSSLEDAAEPTESAQNPPNSIPFLQKFTCLQSISSRS